jgi:hypothetical protein
VSEGNGISPDIPAVKFCGEPTESGEPCRQVVGIHSASGKCLWHDEARREEAREARQKGAGLSNSRPRQPDDIPPPPEPKTLADLIAWHSWIAGAFARGQIDKAQCTGQSYNLQALRQALVSRDLEREVEELRAQVKVLREQRAA